MRLSTSNSVIRSTTGTGSGGGGSVRSRRNQRSVRASERSNYTCNRVTDPAAPALNPPRRMSASSSSHCSSSDARSPPSQSRRAAAQIRSSSPASRSSRPSRLPADPRGEELSIAYPSATRTTWSGSSVWKMATGSRHCRCRRQADSRQRRPRRPALRRGGARLAGGAGRAAAP